MGRVVALVLGGGRVGRLLIPGVLAKGRVPPALGLFHGAVRAFRRPSRLLRRPRPDVRVASDIRVRPVEGPVQAAIAPPHGGRRRVEGVTTATGLAASTPGLTVPVVEMVALGAVVVVTCPVKSALVAKEDEVGPSPPMVVAQAGRVPKETVAGLGTRGHVGPTSLRRGRLGGPGPLALVQGQVGVVVLPVAGPLRPVVLRLVHILRRLHAEEDEVARVAKERHDATKVVGLLARLGQLLLLDAGTFLLPSPAAALPTGVLPRLRATFLVVVVPVPTFLAAPAPLFIEAVALLVRGGPHTGVRPTPRDIPARVARRLARPFVLPPNCQY